MAKDDICREIKAIEDQLTLELYMKDKKAYGLLESEIRDLKEMITFED